MNIDISKVTTACVMTANLPWATCSQLTYLNFSFVHSREQTIRIELPSSICRLEVFHSAIANIHLSSPAQLESLHIRNASAGFDNLQLASNLQRLALESDEEDILATLKLVADHRFRSFTLCPATHSLELQSIVSRIMSANTSIDTLTTNMDITCIAGEDIQLFPAIKRYSLVDFGSRDSIRGFSPTKFPNLVTLHIDEMDDLGFLRKAPAIRTLRILQVRPPQV